ncbi:MAG: hypothetical protein HY979_01600, partial [Candidatus Magasanikbacteria bacterium]|nr:hypothetical protein [Candidatus Magasanikbacteria bacterium]
MAVRYTTQPKYRRKIFTSRKPAVSPRWPTTFDEPQNHWQRTLLVFFLLLGTAWIYLVFYSDFFSLNLIQITGPNNEINAALEQKMFDIKQEHRYLILRRNNIFLFKLSEVNKITQDLGLEKISWSKNKLDRSVFISYQEKEPKIIVVYSNEPHYLDQYGDEIKKLNPYMSIENLPTIFIPDESKKLVTPDFINRIYQINDLASNISLKIAAFKIDKQPEINFKKTATTGTKPSVSHEPELIATAKNKWDIHFGEEILIGPGLLDKQLYNLQVLYKTKLNKIDPKNITY